jgi:N-acyl-D-aspartate/D-glutamate deacylase
MSERYDILIKGSRIVDGTGKAAFRGNIGVKGEKIVAVGNVKGDAVREIDASGLVACPGFIDIHNHGDDNILLYPRAENYVMQGITTFVGGNCGGSPAPIKDFITTPSTASAWWHEIEPNTYGPPYFLPLAKYANVLKEKLGYGMDWRTFGEFLAKVEKTGISVNYVPLVGHNTVRVAVMGMDFQRRAKPGEIEEMKGHVDEAMKSGAHGFTTNLDGIPGAGEFANTDEVVELAKVVQKYGGIYATHHRNADNDYPAPPEEWGYGICHNISPEEMPVSKYYALLEAVEICRRAKIRTQLSHLMNVYLIYQYFPEYLQEAAAKATLDIIDKAREEGLDIAFDIQATGDMHGVLMTASDLTALFPIWLRKCGSKESFVKNLRVNEFRSELKKEILSGRFKFLMIHPKTDPFWTDRVYIISCKNKGYEGKTIAEIAHTKKTNPIYAVFDIIIEDSDTKFNCTDMRNTDTIQRVFVQHPVCMIGQDITILPSFEHKPHGAVWAGGGAPGLGFYGFYPYYIRVFVKEKRYLSLEEAVKKATYMPAQRFRLNDRGIVSPGACADILLFDFEKLKEKGTQLEPRQAPEGIAHVLVNGQVAYEKTAHTDATSGRVLRRT